MKQTAKEIHARATKKFVRRKVVTVGKNDVWAGDLVDMAEWKDKNDGYKYMINIIDVFTRYAWSIPLKDKTAKSILEAFKSILRDSGGKPNRLWTDKGSEFYNKDFIKFLKSNDISLYSTFGEHKASSVERFNRTLKTLMWKRFSEEGTRRWIDMLPELMKEYNNRKHSVIKMTPKQAYKLSKEEERKLWKSLYKEPYKNIKSKEKINKLKPKFKVGDWVRISRVKGVFEKGYHPNWSQEIFKIKAVSSRFPFVYYLQDYNEEQIEGSFYEQELQKVKYPNVFLVENIEKTRRHKGKIQHFVKWLGWDKKWNQWIDDKDLVD